MTPKTLEHEKSAMVTWNICRGVGEKALSKGQNWTQISLKNSHKNKAYIFQANKDTSKLAARCAQTVGKLSPTSMKITHRQMTAGKKLATLKECLEMEFKMVVRCCIYPDFYEGVRALLVDKDNSPKWNPPTLAEVNDTLVDKYFEDLPQDLQFKL